MSHAEPPSLKARVAAAILEAAGGVLAREGDAASMSDVALAAGVARATLYRYFPTREALLAALSDHALEDATGRLAAARLDEVDVSEGVARAVRALVAVGDPLVVLARERAREEAPAFDAQIVATLRRLVERGQGEGVLRADVPAGWLVESLVALAVTVLPHAPALGPEDTVSTIASLFLDGARGG
jgi:AcrR family transcriptional regulator